MSIQNEKKVLFDPQTRVAPLGLIAMKGASELGDKVNSYLTGWANEAGYDDINTFLVNGNRIGFFLLLCQCHL